jgi:hypothetical protein
VQSEVSWLPVRSEGGKALVVLTEVFVPPPSRFQNIISLRVKLLPSKPFPIHPSSVDLTFEDI